MHFALQPLAIIHLAVLPNVDAATSNEPVLELAVEATAVRPVVLAVPMLGV